MSKKYVSGTGEWAAHSVNIQTGCPHDCLYCYAKTNSVKFREKDPATWGKPVINMKAVTMKRGRKEGTVMFPTAHDITPDNVDACCITLKNLLEAGNKVLIVTKPHLECVKTMCLKLYPWKKNVLFRFTIGSRDNATLKKWEPGAPSFEERLESLEYAYNGGFPTSVSCEPMLDANISAVVEEVRPFITDAVWLGKPNKITTRIVMNNPSDPDAAAKAGELEAMFPDSYIWELYRKYEKDPLIKWKDSVKAVVGLERMTEKGMDR